MFQRVEVDVLGLVENMSYFLCPNCSERHHPFGSDGGRDTALRLGVDFWGEMPLEEEVRRGGDSGRPAVLEGGEIGRRYGELADEMVAALQKLAAEGG